MNFADYVGYQTKELQELSFVYRYHRQTPLGGQLWWLRDWSRSRMKAREWFEMANSTKLRILENGPHGWYWEIICDHKVVGRGVSETRREAYAQAAQAKKKIQPQRTFWFALPNPPQS